MENYELHKKIASELLTPLWGCVDEKFKTDNPKDVWRYFENFVKTSANTANLVSFFGKFKKLCPFDWKHKYEKSIMTFIRESDSDTVLEIIRGDECAFLILLVREENKHRKELLKKEKS